MIVCINNENWTCRAAVRTKDTITIYYGKHTEPNEELGIPSIELTCNFSGAGIEDAYVADGDWEYDEFAVPTKLDELEAKLTYIEIMTDTYI